MLPTTCSPVQFYMIWTILYVSIHSYEHNCIGVHTVHTNMLNNIPYSHNMFLRSVWGIFLYPCNVVFWVACGGFLVSFSKEWKASFEGAIISVVWNWFLSFHYLISSYCVIDAMVWNLFLQWLNSVIWMFDWDHKDFSHLDLGVFTAFTWQ